MRIESQAPVYTLTNSSANQNLRPNAPQPEPASNNRFEVSQNTRVQEQKLQEKQDVKYEAAKNLLYDSSGQTNRLPGTVSLFDTTA